jgi:hypothetical protein
VKPSQLSVKNHFPRVSFFLKLLASFQTLFYQSLCAIFADPIKSNDERLRTLKNSCIKTRHFGLDWYPECAHS